MDKIDQLFIRACKTWNSHKRLRSVYRRFYLAKEDQDRHIAGILIRICDEHNICSMKIFTRAMQLPKSLAYGITPNTPVDLKIIRILSPIIRYTKPDKFKGYITPARFKNNPRTAEQQ